ncbi:hypothetical protein AB0M20_02785 [Actinoplanes sp. NPDC051633]|uniref:hypothetical protein n=1 Tax=Actinoplanes sp. NPDC051633 TaxID=3155670 RepID=UPI00341605FA
MRSSFDDRLVRTLNAAAQAAPAPQPSFPDGVARIRRRRSRVRAAGAAAVTAIVALAGGVALWPDAGRPATPPASSVVELGPMRAVDFANAKSFEQVWPRALVSLPGRLPDGRTYTVEAALGNDTYLGVPSDDKGLYTPVLINGRTGAVTSVAPGVSGDVFGGLSITRNLIVWLVAQEKDGLRTRDVWTKPRDGSRPATKLATFEDSTITAAEAGDTLYADVHPLAGNETKNTIYRLRPGAPPEKVAGSEGWTLANGTWAVTSPGPLTVEDLQKPRPRVAPTFWNVATGEKITPVTPAGGKVLSCIPSACVGVVGDSIVIYGADGNNPIRGDGAAAKALEDADGTFTNTGRFVQLRFAIAGVDTSGSYLLDRRTGTVGEQTGMTAMAHDVIEIDDPTTKKSRKAVFDLTRIP